MAVIYTPLIVQDQLSFLAERTVPDEVIDGASFRQRYAVH